MDPILYSVVDGGSNDLIRQEVIANNLANLNTSGFKANLYEAQTWYQNSANGQNLTNGGTYIVQYPNGVDMSPGALITTGRPLDVAVSGNGWLAIQGPNGEAYTKGGSLKIDANGQLMTASGQAVLGDGGAISIPPAQSVEIGSDGTITIVPLDGDSRTVAILDRLKLVTLDVNNAVKNADGSLQLRGGGAAPVDETIQIVGGALEGSNVNAVDQMVEMISAGRDFDAQMKILSIVDDDAQKLAQVLQD